MREFKNQFSSTKDSDFFSKSYCGRSFWKMSEISEQNIKTPACTEIRYA